MDGDRSPQGHSLRTGHDLLCANSGAFPDHARAGVSRSACQRSRAPGRRPDPPPGPPGEPRPDDVEDFIDRWEDDADGPRSGFDWLAVARMWLRAGEANRAESALERAEDRIPEALFLIDLARIAFLRGEVSGTDDYWAACGVADETASTEIWLDVEVLATPDELAAWGGFRTLPAADRDECSFFRRFWNRRAAASGMGVDERVLSHYERSRFALEHYRRRGRVRPSLRCPVGSPHEFRVRRSGSAVHPHGGSR